MYFVIIIRQSLEAELSSAKLNYFDNDNESKYFCFSKITSFNGIKFCVNFSLFRIKNKEKSVLNDFDI